MTIYDYQKAKTPEECILRSGDIRVSVLTDAPTQTVIDRSFAKPQFEASETADKMVVTTQSAEFIIDKRSLKTECVLGGKRMKPSPRTNLGGTARTLDGTFGVVRMLKSGRGKDRFFFANVRGGVMSSNGVAELDDSRTLILGADGTVSPPSRRERRASRTSISLRSAMISRAVSRSITRLRASRPSCPSTLSATGGHAIMPTRRKSIST